MKPGRFNLPIIWRGSTYPAITLSWLNPDGQPLDLTGWTPHAKSHQIDFHPLITDVTTGKTQISLTKEETSNLKLGVEFWDWIWTKEDITTSPLLFGVVIIKEPETDT